jgi:hypothetical protein
MRVKNGAFGLCQRRGNTSALRAHVLQRARSIDLLGGALGSRGGVTIRQVPFRLGSRHYPWTRALNCVISKTVAQCGW